MFLLFARLRRHASGRFGAVAALSLLLTGWATASGALADPAPQASPAAAPAPDASAAPAPDASTAPGSQPVGPNAAPPRSSSPNSAPAKFGHLPIIDLVPVFTNPQFYSNASITKKGTLSPNQLINSGTGYDPIDLGGTVKIPITPIFSASFDRLIDGTLNVPNAPITNTVKGVATTTYPAFTRDAVLVYRLDQQIKRLQIEEGMYFRHRIAGGSNSSNNPLLPTISSTEAHYGYAGLTYVTGGVPWLLNSFLTLNINADTQSIDHHVACLLTTFEGVEANCPKGNTTGVVDENPLQSRVWETDQYFQVTVPFKHGVTLLAQDRWGALNFYENAPYPYRWTTSQTYLLTKRFNRVFALSLRARDQWSIQGITSTYAKPNSQHNGTIDVLADFKIDTNNLH